MMYWMSLSRTEYSTMIQTINKEEQAALELDRRTIDAVATGQQQPDADHSMKGVNTNAGVYNNEHWRDASNGGYFSYQMATKGLTNLSLMVRYWGNEGGSRTFDILIDNQVVATENVSGKWNKSSFVNVEYPISAALLQKKSVITVTFRAKTGNYAGGVFYLRLLKPSGLTSSIELPVLDNNMMIFKRDGNVVMKTQDESPVSAFSLFSITGLLILSGKGKGDEVTFGIGNLTKGVYLLQYRSKGSLVSRKILL